MIQSFNNSILQRLVSKGKLILPFYHTISDRPLPHIKHLYAVKNIKEFSADLDYLLSRYVPIDAQTLIKLKRNEISLQKPSFYLSFDDGLSQTYDIIAPILWSKGIPATFFINTAFIDNKALFYRYQASLIIEKALQKSRSTPEFKKEILSVSYQNRQKLKEFISQEEISSFLHEEKPYLTTEEIQSLSRQGFSIGSHSIEHPLYAKETLMEQIKQTKESVDFICNSFNQPLRLFAFPFTDSGVSIQFFREIEKHVDLTFGTAGIKQDSVSFNLQRIAAEPTKSNLSLKTIIQREKVEFLIKKLLGKHIVKHKDV